MGLETHHMCRCAGRRIVVRKAGRCALSQSTRGRRDETSSQGRSPILRAHAMRAVVCSETLCCYNVAEGSYYGCNV